MTLSEIFDVYKMLDKIVNEGDNVKDYGIDNKSVWATLESGKIFEFFPNK